MRRLWSFEKYALAISIIILGTCVAIALVVGRR